MKKAALILLALLVLLVLGAGYFMRQITSAPALEWQDPNPVEAHEAHRKLKLFASAQENNRRGFVRLSEVEINSFLRDAYHTNKVETNGIAIFKSALLLGSSNVTFVTWLKKPLLGFELPLVWQRTIEWVPQENGSEFEVVAMQLGEVEIPEDWWPKVNELFGQSDLLFQPKREWVSSLPALRLAKNDLSNLPELRLYTFVPPATESK